VIEENSMLDSPALREGLGFLKALTPQYFAMLNRRGRQYTERLDMFSK